MGNDTKEKIIKAAMELFAQNGFDGTTVRQICKKANVNVAMIKYYFGSKLSIYNALLDNFFARLHHFILESGIIEEPDIKKKIVIAIESGCNFVQSNADMLLIMTRELLDRRKIKEDLPLENIVPLFSVIWGRSMEDGFAGEIYPGLTRDVASMILTGLVLLPVLYGGLFSSLANRPLKEFQKLYTDSISKLFLHGLQSFIDNKEKDE